MARFPLLLLPNNAYHHPSPLLPLRLGLSQSKLARGRLWHCTGHQEHRIQGDRRPNQGRNLVSEHGRGPGRGRHRGGGFLLFHVDDALPLSGEFPPTVQGESPLLLTTHHAPANEGPGSEAGSECGSLAGATPAAGGGGDELPLHRGIAGARAGERRGARGGEAVGGNCWGDGGKRVSERPTPAVRFHLLQSL